MSTADAAEVGVDKTRSRLARSRERLWYVLPQATSRLASVYIFAIAAHRVDTQYLGGLALTSAFASGAYACAPAIVGRPLAVLSTLDERRRIGATAQSGAIASSVVVGLILILPALLTGGAIRAAFWAGAAGVPAMMLVESTYWRGVFIEGPRRSAIAYSAAYLFQAVATTVAAPLVSSGWLIFIASAALAPPALVILARSSGLSLRAAREWLFGRTGLWLPYLAGVAVTVAVVQAIPTVLIATSGLGAASTYRAGEVAFGACNLLVGVSSQMLLTQRPTRPRRTYALASTVLAGVTALNGLVIWAVPESLVAVFVGHSAPLLLAQLLIITVQRCAMAVGTVAAILLVPHLPPRLSGLLDAVSAAVSLTALVVGGVVDGLRGALIGLAAAEVALAVIGGLLLRNRADPDATHELAGDAETTGGDAAAQAASEVEA